MLQVAVPDPASPFVSNTLLAGAKVLLSLMSGSLSLMADAIHTFADSLTSLVVIVGFRMAGKPADDEHPFGHARIESIATLIIGVLLAVAAVELGHSAVNRLLEPTPVQAPIWMIVIVILMAAGKEVMARFSFELGRLIGSGALAADAWHHRSDVFATLLVAVAFIASRFGIHWLDGAAGIGVALIVAWAAYHIIAGAAHPLIGEKMSDEEISRIASTANSVEGVRGVHDIVVQRFGSFQIISLHVVVSRDLNIVEAHDISHAVELKLQKELGAHATVHIDPKGQDHPDTARIQSIVLQAIVQMDGLRDIHDLRVEAQSTGTLAVSFDVNTSKEIPAAVKETHRNELTEKIRNLFPDAKVDVQFDPPFCLAASDSNPPEPFL
jgi:cation diffusion facilitator family transporter